MISKPFVGGIGRNPAFCVTAHVRQASRIIYPSPSVSNKASTHYRVEDSSCPVPQRPTASGLVLWHFFALPNQGSLKLGRIRPCARLGQNLTQSRHFSITQSSATRLGAATCGGQRLASLRTGTANQA